MSSTSVAIWVLTVDDDPVVLTSLRQYFAATDDIRIAAEATNGREALEKLRSISVDVVLSDIHMPDLDGISLLKEIQKQKNPPAFVAITALDADETMIEILSGGGAGYIIKSARPREIITAVRDSVSGGTTVSPKSLTRLVEYLPAKDPEPVAEEIPSEKTPPELSVQQKLVLRYLCEGLSNAEIALHTEYSEATVKKHVSQMINLFKVTSRLSLAVTAIRMGLADQ